MEWLNKLFDKLLSLLPVIMILSPNFAGVRVTALPFCKIWFRIKGPGWYLFWPMVQQFHWAEVTTQVVDLKSQSVRLKDGGDIVVSGALEYRVTNVYNYLLEVQDADKSLATLCLGTIADEVVKTGTEDIEKLKTAIRTSLRKSASGWGVRIDEVYITDFGKVRNLRLLGENPSGS